MWRPKSRNAATSPKPVAPGPSAGRSSAKRCRPSGTPCMRPVRQACYRSVATSTATRPHRGEAGMPDRQSSISTRFAQQYAPKPRPARPTGWTKPLAPPSTRLATATGPRRLSSGGRGWWTGEWRSWIVSGREDLNRRVAHAGSLRDQATDRGRRHLPDACRSCRFVGMVLAEQDGEWQGDRQGDRRYFLPESMMTIDPVIEPGRCPPAMLVAS
jgi:hypothetical protein